MKPIKVKLHVIYNLILLLFISNSIFAENIIQDDSSTDVDTSLTQVTEVSESAAVSQNPYSSAISMKDDKVITIASPNIMENLQGQIAGVNITKSSSRPGDPIHVNIRGISSATGNSSPLYVIDGIPYYNIVNGSTSVPDIPLESIETIEFLKDAASIAAYGSKGANGVVLITTKKGTIGTPSIRFSGYFGTQQRTSSEIPLLGTSEYINTQSEIYDLDMRSLIVAQDPGSINNNTDFTEDIKNDNNFIQNYNLGLNGGNESLSYNIGTDYFKQNGNLINSGYQRFVTNAGAKLTKGKFQAAINLHTINATKDQEPASAYEYAIMTAPYNYALPYNIDEEPNSINVIGYNSSELGLLAREVNKTNESTKDRFHIMANLKYEIIPGLNIKLNLGKSIQNTDQKHTAPYLLTYENDAIIPDTVGVGTVLKVFESFTQQHIEPAICYEKTISKHNIYVELKSSVEKVKYNYDIAEKENFAANTITQFDGGADINYIEGFEVSSYLESHLAQFAYNYDNKYLLSGNLTIEGSPEQALGFKYANFYGIAAGWNVSEESFMPDMVSLLNIHASYGTMGKQSNPHYFYYTLPGSKDQSTDGGFKLGLLDNKIGLSVDYYTNTRNDLIYFDPVALYSIANQKEMLENNTISMENKGFDIEAFYLLKSAGNDLNFQFNTTFSTYDNKVTDLKDFTNVLYPESAPGGIYSYAQSSTTGLKEGYSVGSFFLVESDGIDATTGDIRMVDVNGDNIIDDDDRVYAGSTLPDYEAGLGLTAEYKNFDANILFYYSHGNKVYNTAKLFAYATGRHEDMASMWTTDNTSTDIPAARADIESFNTYSSLSDYFLEDGSFLRLRNISIGYTFNLSKLIPDSNLRIYGSATNPLTFTKYTGFDPEVGGNGYSTRGIDGSYYPAVSSFVFGIQLNL